MLLLNNADITSVLTMDLCLNALDAVFHEMAAGEAVGMGRIDVYVPSAEAAPYYRWSVMTGGSKKDGFVCARMLSDMVSWPVEHGKQRENKYASRPGTFCGLLMLFSARNGEPVALINDGVLQHIRVGGGAGLGVKYLSRADSHVVAMIGSGGMARTYMDAFCAVRDITTVKIYSPNVENARRYAEEIGAKHGLQCEIAASAREAVRGADIVSCCTSSIEPVFDTAWLEPGMHVTDVTPDETKPGFRGAVDIALRPGDYTPYLETLPEEGFYAAHGFLGYVAGNPDEQAMVPHRSLPFEIATMPTLPQLLAGKMRAREFPEQTTWFLNMGAIGVQFEAVAAAVYREAARRGLGHEIPTDWFLQNVRD